MAKDTTQEHRGLASSTVDGASWRSTVSVFTRAVTFSDSRLTKDGRGFGGVVSTGK